MNQQGSPVPRQTNDLEKMVANSPTAGKRRLLGRRARLTQPTFMTTGLLILAGIVALGFVIQVVLLFGLILLSPPPVLASDVA